MRRYATLLAALLLWAPQDLLLTKAGKPPAAAGGGGGLNCNSGVNGYTCYHSLTVDHTKVGSGTQANFPVMVAGTFDGTGGLPDLRVTGSGGKIQHTTTETGGPGITVPADAVFTSDSGCSTLLKWEWKTYSSTTGAAVAFVNAGTGASQVNGTGDSAFFLCYGKSSISTWQGDVAGSWNTGYISVHHLGNGTTLDLHDSTGNALDLQNANSVTAGVGWDAAAGGGTAAMNGTSQYLYNTAEQNPTNVITIAYWTKATTGAAAGGATVEFTSSSIGDRVLVHGPYSDKQIYWDFGNATSGQGRVSADYTSYMDAWNYISVVFAASDNFHRIFVNGSQVASNNHVDSVTTRTGILVNQYDGGPNYNAQPLAEIRISNVGRPAAWLLTEYNSMFYIPASVSSGKFLLVSSPL